AEVSVAASRWVSEDAMRDLETCAAPGSISLRGGSEAGLGGVSVGTSNPQPIATSRWTDRPRTHRFLTRLGIAGCSYATTAGLDARLAPSGNGGTLARLAGDRARPRRLVPYFAGIDAGNLPGNLDVHRFRRAGSRGGRLRAPRSSTPRQGGARDRQDAARAGSGRGVIDG